MNEETKYIFFWNGIYSQWYKAQMFIDGINYTSCEQYMMHQKALTFEDMEIAEEILKAKTPAEQKMLGRKIKNFDRTVWDKVCMSIVYKGNYYKFTQNEELKKELLSTGNKIIVEASPIDFIWGIGMAEADEGIENPINWKGLNLLGNAIMLVRNELQDPYYFL